MLLQFVSVSDVSFPHHCVTNVKEYAHFDVHDLSSLVCRIGRRIYSARTSPSFCEFCRCKTLHHCPVEFSTHGEIIVTKILCGVLMELTQYVKGFAIGDHGPVAVQTYTTRVHYPCQGGYSNSSRSVLFKSFWSVFSCLILLERSP